MERNLGIDPGLAALRRKALGEELDYGFVMQTPRRLLKFSSKIKSPSKNKCFDSC